MKRTILLLAIIAILCALWAGGWFFVADKVENVVNDAKQRLLSRGQEFSCGDETVSGFPFRISYNCSSLGYRDTSRGVSLQSGAMRSAAQAYQPGKAVVEFDGPATLEAPGNQAFNLDWSSLRASLNASLDGVNTFSVVARNLNFQPRDQRFDSANIERAQLHGRKIRTNDVNFVIRSEGANSPQNRWPGFDMEASVQFAGIFQQLLTRPDLLTLARRQGLSGQLDKFDYRLADGGVLSVTGPFEVSSNGILTGKFQINVRELQEIVSVGKNLFPQHQQVLDQIAAGLLLVSNSGGSEGLKFPLTVRNGKASVGLIPVGDIPPIF